jgi:poly-beta-1,6-N-acetyl-D-glucosamine synthase
MARLLIRMQRLEFSSWTADALRRNRKTYVLGGQATLFNAAALRAVAERNHTREPWDTSTLVGDDQRLSHRPRLRRADVHPPVPVGAAPQVG